MKTVSIRLDEHAFCYYNTSIDHCIEEPGGAWRTKRKSERGRPNAK